MARLEELWNRDMQDMIKSDPFLQAIAVDHDQQGKDSRVEDWEEDLDLYSPHALLLATQPFDFSVKGLGSRRAILDCSCHVSHAMSYVSHHMKVECTNT